MIKSKKVVWVDFEDEGEIRSTPVYVVDCDFPFLMGQQGIKDLYIDCELPTGKYRVMQHKKVRKIISSPTGHMLLCPSLIKRPVNIAPMQEYSRTGSGSGFVRHTPADVQRHHVDLRPDQGAGNPLLTPGNNHYNTREGDSKNVSFGTNDDDFPFESDIFYSDFNDDLFDEGNSGSIGYVPFDSVYFSEKIPRGQWGLEEVKDAMRAELDQFDYYKSFDVVDSHPSLPKLRTCWVVTRKTTEGGQVKVKARLVIMGNHEKPVDDLSSDSPTCERDTLKLFFSVAASKKWDLHTTDFKNAFLQGDELGRDVYVIPPP